MVGLVRISAYSHRSAYRWRIKGLAWRESPLRFVLSSVGGSFSTLQLANEKPPTLRNAGASLTGPH